MSSLKPLQNKERAHGMTKKLSRFTICLWSIRALVGSLYLFSGLIKLNDPLGFAYKLEEYLTVFHANFFLSATLIIAFSLCILEVLLGSSLVLGAAFSSYGWVLLSLSAFFTLLTLYSAIFEVVADCGCFGEAIHLTPWQSFAKSAILLILVSSLWKNRHEIKPLVNKKHVMHRAFTIIFFGSLAFGLYNYYCLPLVDVSPYRVGANLIQAMEVSPPGAPLDVYEITYTLKNKHTGFVKMLTDAEYIKTGIWKDSTWEIIGTPQRKLIQKGYEAKIKDLRILDAQGRDHTLELFKDSRYTLTVVAYDLEKTNTASFDALTSLLHQCIAYSKVHGVLLTSSSVEKTKAFLKEHHLNIDAYYTDGSPLKSMIRSNPGLLLLYKGVVIQKWSCYNAPSYEELQKYLYQKP